MNISKRCAAALTTAALSGAATLGAVSPTFAADQPDPHETTSTNTNGVATAPAQPGEEDHPTAPRGEAEDHAADEGAGTQQDPGEFLPGTVSIGGVPSRPAQPAPPAVEGFTHDDLLAFIASLSETCLNKAAVELKLTPEGGVTASLTPEDIAEGIIEAGAFRAAGLIPSCIVAIVTQLTNGVFPPEALQRVADLWGIDLPDNILIPGQVE
ncbi:hypothetical protein [Streptomyces sp. NPDC002962]|uniref:hypothetical protein n=1 Tax=Streptomyces sp. NPDC002962 TaxID=3364674 RepID=UPI0036A6CFE8